MVRLSRITNNFMLVLLGCMLLIAPNAVWAEHQGDASVDQSGAEDALIIKGKVKSISFEEHIIVVKPNKGEKVTVTFTDQTPLRGFASLKEIEKKQPVKILYRVEGGVNRAVKIEKIPETGC